MNKADNSDLAGATDRIAVNAIALTLVSVTACESLVTWVSHSNIAMARRVFFVDHNVWLFFLVGLMTVAFCIPMGVKGILASLSSSVIALILLFNFRGAWVWPGTFDRFEESSLRWIFPLGLGFVAGCTLFAFKPLRRVTRLHGSVRFWTGCLAVSALVAYWTNDSYIMGSQWPPTRFIGLAIGTVLVLFIGGLE